jgi:hypothetical protein
MWVESRPLRCRATRKVVGQVFDELVPVSVNAYCSLDLDSIRRGWLLWPLVGAVILRSHVQPQCRTSNNTYG